jgi:hypothetical protein
MIVKFIQKISYQAERYLRIRSTYEIVEETRFSES